MHLESAGLTDTGQCRTHNEDCFFVSSEMGLYIVADGMGGHAAGEVASSTAVSVIYDFIHHDATHNDTLWPDGLDPALELPHRLLVAGAKAANLCIYSLGLDNPIYSGMGTTLVAVLAQGDQLYAISVGDSRLYRLRDGLFQQLTEDHTWVNEQVQRNLLTPQEARHHRWRNVITRALGSSDDLEIDTFSDRLIPGDYYLLCSDGLTTMLHDDLIAEFLRNDQGDLTQTCQALVDAANAAGGKDNITIVLLRAVP